MTVTIDPKWIVKLQGKEFCQYPGLLDLAHRIGLVRINTEIVSYTGDTAVVMANVTMESGQSFTGIGDASTSNVSRNIAPHLLRMAETRAKARALRDATNVGMAAIEELSGDETDLKETKSKAQPKSTGTSDQPLIPVSAWDNASKRLRAIVGQGAKSCMVNVATYTDAMKEYIRATYKVESTKDLSPDQLLGMGDAIEEDPSFLLAYERVTIPAKES